MKVEYTVNPRIVRGLDYYTRTVFEFVTEEIGAQGTICGGGRYDGLIEQLGGKHVPALGFGMGIERLLLVMDSQNCDYFNEKKCDLYFATMGEKALQKAMELSIQLREYGYRVDYDMMNRGLKAQMKYANKIGAVFTAVIGDNELETQKVRIKHMDSGEETEISLDNLPLVFEEIYLNKMLDFMDENSDSDTRFAFMGDGDIS